MFGRQETTLIRPARYEPLTGLCSIDPDHSTIGFSVRHAMITNVRGNSTACEGLLELDGSRPTRSGAYLSVQTAVQTRVHRIGTRMSPARICLRRIKDVEVPVHLDLLFGGAGRDTYAQRRIGLEGTAVMRRSGWGLVWNAVLATGGVLLSDKVKPNLDLSAVRLDRAEAAAWPERLAKSPRPTRAGHRHRCPALPHADADPDPSVCTAAYRDQRLRPPVICWYSCAVGLAICAPSP